VSIEAHNFMKFSPYNTINDVSHHEFTLMFGHIQADMRDVAFYFRKKSGIPKLTDSGLADVLLGGHGLTVRILLLIFPSPTALQATVHLVSADKDKSSVFKVKSVHVKVDSLKFSIRDSKHDILYKTLRPLATALIKKQIQRAVADAITTGMEYVDGQLVAVRDRVSEARASSDSSSADILRSTFRGKTEDGEGSVGARSVERRSQFKVVAKRDSALLPEYGHPSGWATKAQERAEAAASGESWHSDACVSTPSIAMSSIDQGYPGSQLSDVSPRLEDFELYYSLYYQSYDLRSFHVCRLSLMYHFVMENYFCQ